MSQRDFQEMPDVRCCRNVLFSSRCRAVLDGLELMSMTEVTAAIEASGRTSRDGAYIDCIRQVFRYASTRLIPLWRLRAVDEPAPVVPEPE